jgi:hypothetical protein
VVTAVGALATLAAAAPAAQGAPCPAASNVLRLNAVPPTTVDDVIEIFVVNAKANAKLVSNLVATVDGTPNQTLRAPKTRASYLLLADTLKAGQHVVGLTWSQVPTGDTPACDGSTSRPLRIYPAGTDLGDPNGPHLSGTWRLRVTPLDFRARPYALRWTLTSTCQGGACDTRLKSSLGLQATLTWSGDAYTFQRQGHKPEPGAGCAIGNRRIPDAFLLYNEISVRITRRAADGSATAFTGKQTRTYEPTTRARARGCDTLIVQTTRLAGTRQRG